MNKTLKIDISEAVNESPALCDHRFGIVTEVWVGAEERPVFIYQARVLSQAWDEAELRVASGMHHFDIIDGLTDPESPLLGSILN